jgi:putative aminopeptidase FrvX
MSIPDSLRSLLTAPGPSGYEDEASAAFRAAAAAFAEVSSDAMGSTVARVAGRGEGPSVAVVGHIDEIGLMVSHVDEKGRLRVQGVGGWDPVILVGQRVELLTRGGRVPGVIGKKPIHLLEEEERKQAPKLKDLHIDIGARDADDARRLVRIGDVGVLVGEPVELPNGRVASRSMDNRLGCFVALEAVRLVAEAGGGAGDVFAVAAVQEEVTFGGSGTTAYSLRPDIAIAVDVTHASDQPGVDPGRTPDAGLGDGAVIARGTILHPAVSRGLIDAAEAEGIPFAVEAMGRNTSTDADAMFAARGGIPTGLVSVPLRYMHSPVEMVELADVEAAARIIAGYILGLEAGADFRR